MEHRLLLVEPSATPGAGSIGLGPLPGFVCERLSWDAASAERLQAAGAHVVVAVATPLTDDILHVFETLGAHPLATPAIAVLPVEIEDRVLQIAARAVDDFLFAPVRGRELQQRLCRVMASIGCATEATVRRLATELGLRELVGRAPGFLDVIGRIPRLARSDSPVLITGETGTGKELCARAIHHAGRRAAQPFIAVDCGALPEQLFENEMFGHHRGAYTDAHREQRGLIALAEGGTLFLDEVDALAPPAQGKLLRFLQERTYRPLGADRFMRADVHVIAATNRDLEAAVRAKQFRADLFFRLNVLALHLPPLRERRADIAELVDHFARAGGHWARRGPCFSGEALRMLLAHDWPGNVRELQNTVIRALVEADGAPVECHHLALSGAASVEPSPAVYRDARRVALEAFERRYVEELLCRHAGNVTRAAREAGKDRRAFGRLVKKHGIERTAV